MEPSLLPFASLNCTSVWYKVREGKEKRKREKRKGGTTSSDTEIVSLCKSQNPRSPSMNLQDVRTVPVDSTSTLGRQMTGSWWLLSQQLICIEI
jgi:hypothetical protein